MPEQETAEEVPHAPARGETPDDPQSDLALTAGQAFERNWILRAIPREEYAWLAPRLEPVKLGLNTVIAEPDVQVEHVYFPETLIASVVSRMQDGGVVEVGTIGREGMIGLSAFLDADAMVNQTLVQLAGSAKRMSASVFADGARERPVFQRLLHRYTHAYLAQVSQTAACNRMHDVLQRCARWILMTHDRVGDADAFSLTQEFLSFMLGVRRAGVTEAEGALQRAGAISYTRGVVTVVDRAKLEAASCECYRIINAHFDRMLLQPGARHPSNGA
jgi:CRP-like cAMP-binding protein